LQGSMQVLSDRLVGSIERDGGKVLLRHTVESIITENGKAIGTTIRNQKTGEVWTETADDIVANVTAQNLVKLLETNSTLAEKSADLSDELATESLASKFPNQMSGYKYRVDKLPPASGAFVIYLGVKESAIPANCPPHLQFLYDYDGEIGENNSLFVSVSHPGDGRAPTGMATVIASSFTDTRIWWNCTDYEGLKQKYTEGAIARLSEYFEFTAGAIVHQESATPRTFARYTARDRGVVGGIGQRIPTFGPFGFANRTPIQNLWLVGDSTHPGEGTAGVSYSALTVVRQMEAASKI
jgi:C-3',4' desaturase CrtD